MELYPDKTTAQPKSGGYQEAPQANSNVQNTAAPLGAAVKIPILLSGSISFQATDLPKSIFKISFRYHHQNSPGCDDQVRGFHFGQVPIHPSVGSALRSPAPSV